MKRLLSAAIVTTVLTLNAAPAFAAGTTTEQYGATTGQYGSTSAYGCETGAYGAGCAPQESFTINKMVQAPTKGGQFVDNLGVTDAEFAPGQTANFQITVNNTGATQLQNVKVVDTLPQFLNYVSGGGTFDSNNHTITYTLATLDSGKSQTFTLVTKVADAKMLPQDQSNVCIINQGSATVDNNTQTDTAQLCIANNKVMGVSTPKTTPATGPEALPLLGIFTSGIAGALLRRKSK